MPRPSFKEDRRGENPGLHLLYVKQAVVHLRSIDRCLAELNGHSNINMWASCRALHRERTKLVRDNAAYADAQEILDSIAPAEKEE